MQRWKDQKNQILALTSEQTTPSSVKRGLDDDDDDEAPAAKRRIRGMKAEFPLLEEELLVYWRECQALGKAVSSTVLRQKAQMLQKKLYPEATSFSASSGWFANFLKRMEHRIQVKKEKS